MKPQTPRKNQTPQIIYNKRYPYSRKVLRLSDDIICATYDYSEWLCIYDSESVAKFHSAKDAVLAYLVSYEGVKLIQCGEDMFKIECILETETEEKLNIEFSNVL
jgi:hypothetical protein